MLKWGVSGSEGLNCTGRPLLATHCMGLVVCWSFYSPLSPPVSEPLTNRVVLLGTLLQDILHPSHHLLNVLLQIANKLGLSKKKRLRLIRAQLHFPDSTGNASYQISGVLEKLIG
jgi:hypothetical protein